MNAIDELAEVLRGNDGQSKSVAIQAFKFFRDMAKKQVIDWDILNAILHDAGED